MQKRYEYDTRDQLKKVFAGNSTEIAKFEYDFSRRRTSKQTANSNLHYVYAGSDVIDEFDSSSALLPLQNRYELGAGEVVKGELRNEPTNYYFSDALGSTTNLSQTSGTQSFSTSVSEYDSFGKVNLQTGASANSIGYTGQRLDTETGLMALGNGERYYSPALARFTQQDSFTGMLATAQSLNRYSYAYNNPLSFRDPSGNNPLAVLAVAAKEVGKRALQGVGGAIVGGIAGGALEFGRQTVQMRLDGVDEGEPGYDWDEVGDAAVSGAAIGFVLGAAPELLPIIEPIGIGLGLGSAAREREAGNYWTSAYDTAASLAPFARRIPGLKGRLSGIWNMTKGAAGDLINKGVSLLKEGFGSLRSRKAPLTQAPITQPQPEMLPPAPERAQIAERSQSPQETRFSVDESGQAKDLQGRGNQNSIGGFTEPTRLPAKSRSTESEELWKFTWQEAHKAAEKGYLKQLRVIEGAMNAETGQMNAKISGNTPSMKLNLPTESLSPSTKPGCCGMPRAAESVIGNSSSQIIVTKGGFRFRKGQWFYVSPCENCNGIMNLNPNLEHSPLPPGVPKGLKPNEQIPFTPPKGWLE